MTNHYRKLWDKRAVICHLKICFNLMYQKQFVAIFLNINFNFYMKLIDEKNKKILSDFFKNIYFAKS